MRSPINVIAVIAWSAVVLGIDRITGDGNAQAVVLIGACAALGAIVGRAWVLLVPLPMVLAIVLYTWLAPAHECSSCRDDMSEIAGAILLAAFAGIGVLTTAMGYVLRLALSRLARSAESVSR
jgi:hypothetical protein